MGMEAWKKGEKRERGEEREEEKDETCKRRKVQEQENDGDEEENYHQEEMDGRDKTTELNKMAYQDKVWPFTMKSFYM